MSVPGDGGVRQNLFQAVKANHRHIVRQMIEAGVNVNETDDNGRTPFIVAAEEGNCECLTELMSEVDDVDHQDNSGDTALHVAARCGHIECVKTLVKNKVNANVRNSNGQTAVCAAAINGHLECVYKLTKKGRAYIGLLPSEETYDSMFISAAARNRNLNSVIELLFRSELDESCDETETLWCLYKNNLSYKKCLEVSKSKSEADKLYLQHNGYIALCCASLLSQPDIVTTLIDIGVDVNHQLDDLDLSNVIPMCCAAEVEAYQCVKVLLAAGADVNRRDRDNQSALSIALEHTSYSDGQIDCVKALVQAGVDVNVKDGRGRTDILLAADLEDEKCMKILLEAGADINVVDMDGKAALHYSSERGHDEGVKLLLKENAPVNIRDKRGRTPLALAAKSGKDCCVKNLILAGADIYIRDMDNERALCKDSQGKFSVEIGNHDEALQSIVTAAWKGQSDKIAQLIENGQEVNVRGECDTTALIAASWEGHVQCLDVLLSKAEIDINAVDHCNRTALFVAACGGHIECMKKILVQKGVCINSRNQDGITPLMITAKNNHFECVNVLMSAGADVTTKDNAGNTSLMAAASNGSDKSLHLLIEACKSISQCDNLCKDALPLAIAFGHVKCVEALFLHASTSMKNFFELKRLLAIAGSIKYRKHQELLRTIIKAGVFHWDLYVLWNMYSYPGGIRNMTRDLMLNGYAPEQFQWGQVICTPLIYAFRNNDNGLARYLVANLYLSQYDINHIQSDKEFTELFLKQRGSEPILRLHSELVSFPWKLEALSFLEILNALRRYGGRQEDALDRSGMLRLLPNILIKKLTFCNPVQHLCVKDWDKIQCGISTLHVWPREEHMEKKSKCHECTVACMSIKEADMR